MNQDEIDSPTDKITRSAYRYPALTNAENVARFESLWAGDESVRQALIDGNMPWVLRVTQEMDNQSDIPISDFLEAGQLGLTDAVDKFNNPEFAFAPDETLKNGYAIWWVRLRFAKLAQSRGYMYDAAGNAVTKSEPDG